MHSHPRIRSSPRKDKRGVDLISDALPFRRLWYCEPDDAVDSVGAQQAYGALFAHDRAIGYYKSVTASYTVPKGVQKFGYVLFFMSDDDLASLRKSGVWKIGRGPVVVLGQETQKQKRRSASPSANAGANQVITIAPSAGKIAHASQITHRDPMNDQQEPAPRPNDLTLDPTYRSFILIPNTRGARTQTTTTLRKDVYAFAFAQCRLISGLSLLGIQIMPIHPH